MTVCDYCQLEMCFICDTENEDCCCGGSYGVVSFNKPQRVLKTSADYEGKPMAQIPNNHREAFKDRPYTKGRKLSSEEELTNPVDAGRQRASDVAPIPEDYMCEWMMLLNAGGGIEPIIGCAGNQAEHRHHGPDKSTLNNGVGVNLHRICTECHNRWHSLNDQYYGDRPLDNRNYLPTGECKEHDRSTRASAKDVIAHRSWWATARSDRQPYRSWSLSSSGVSDSL